MHQLIHFTVTVCGSPNLAPDTVYEFRVQAETALGTGPFSNSTPFTTPENGMIIVVSIQLAFSVYQFLTISCINCHTYVSSH